jgi:hypothetical protein
MSRAGAETSACGANRQHHTKYVPLRQRAGTQKAKRRELLVQNVIDNTTCGNIQRQEDQMSITCARSRKVALSCFTPVQRFLDQHQYWPRFARPTN